MPRGPADRPIRTSEEDLGLQAAMRQALERGAAPGIPARAPDADPPTSGVQVRQTAPAQAGKGVSRLRGARSWMLPKAKSKGRKESPGRDKVPDPGGRGSAVDLRA